MLKVLETQNSWDAFRRAGGFTGLLSLVMDMEGALADPPAGDVWSSLGHQPLLDLLLLALHILASAVHLHTVNAHHFESGGFYEKLAEALLQLGCFHAPEKETWDGEEAAENRQSPGKSFQHFVELADAGPSSPSAQSSLPVTLRTCVRLLSYLDQFATGTYSPLQLNLGPEPENGCEGERPTGSAGPEGGVYSTSPPVQWTCGHQSVEEAHGRSRTKGASVSSVCSESQYGWTQV